MIATAKRRTWLGGSLTLTAALVLACTADAHADRVRVYESRSHVAISVGSGHGAVAIRSTPRRLVESRRVWREPLYEWREAWVEIPPEVEQRRVPRYDTYGRQVGYRYIDVVIAPARRVLRTERVVVRAGYYETVHDRTCGPNEYAFDSGPGAGHFVIEKRPKHRRLRRAVRALHAVSHHSVRRAIHAASHHSLRRALHAASHHRVRRHHRRPHIRHHRR